MLAAEGKAGRLARARGRARVPHRALLFYGLLDGRLPPLLLLARLGRCRPLGDLARTLGRLRRRRIALRVATTTSTATRHEHLADGRPLLSALALRPLHLLVLLAPRFQRALELSELHACQPLLVAQPPLLGV